MHEPRGFENSFAKIEIHQQKPARSAPKTESESQCTSRATSFDWPLLALCLTSGAISLALLIGLGRLLYWALS